MLLIFHQNSPFAAIGGVERYLCNLIVNNADDIAIATDSAKFPLDLKVIDVSYSGIRGLPNWLPYSLCVFRLRKRIRAFIREESIMHLDFSRPEYVFVSWLFKGKKGFTFHGTGPEFASAGVKLIHFISSCLACIVAHKIIVVGRDGRAIPKPVRRIAAKKTSYIDAWYSTEFGYRPHVNDHVIRVIYAGRIVPQKNPKLLYEFVRRMDEEFGENFEFNYCGPDSSQFPADIAKSARFHDHGPLGPTALAALIGLSDFAMLFSNGGEGSPFIIPEVLAVGRGFVLAPLPGLVAAYADQEGVEFADEWDFESFRAAALRLKARFDDSEYPASISQKIASRASKASALNIFKLLSS